MDTTYNLTQAYFKGYSIGLAEALQNFKKRNFKRKKIDITLFKSKVDIEYLKGYDLGFKNGTTERK